MSRNFLSVIVAVALSGTLGCKPSHSNGPSRGGGGGHGHAHGHAASAPKEDHGHEHEERTGQVTIWTDRFEIFAEYKAPVVEKPATFITHVTDLSTLEPKREGPIRFLMQLGTEPELEHLHAGPSRPGIYLPALSFPKAGKWSLKLSIDDAVVDLGLVEVFGDPHTAAHAELPESPEGISFLKEQQWKILTRSERVQEREVVETIPLHGTVAPAPGSLASIIAPLAGRLVLPEPQKLPVPGERVTEGQLLALLQPTFSEQTSRLLEAEANFLRATATYEQSKLVLERTKRLAAEQAKSPRELQEAEFAFASAEANYKAAVALSSTYKNMTSGKDQTNGLTDFSFVELRAPRAGIIGSLGQRLGELIQPDQVLFTVFDPKQIWIEAKLPENKLKHIPGQPQAFLQEGSKLVPLTFVYAGITIDPLTRSIPVTYSISDTNAPLRLGQTVRMDVVTRRVEKGIAIPESAIVEEEGNPVVFVQVAGETFEKRELVLGVRGGGWVQVLQGLQPGERLVTKGAYAIRLASVSNAIPSHGHAH